MTFISSRFAFGHLETAQQLAYALTDQVLYSTGEFRDVTDLLPDIPGVDNKQILRLLAPSVTNCFTHLVSLMIWLFIDCVWP
jgi:hypothetical protein